MALGVQHFVQDLKSRNEDTRYSAAVALQHYINAGMYLCISILLH